MLTSRYKAAVIQMNSQTTLDENLEQAYHLIKQASENKALLAGLPENFAYLGGLSMRIERAREIAERVSRFLSDSAREFDIYLLGGSYPVPDQSGKVYNHSTLVSPGGRVLAAYDKIHLFDVTLGMQESYTESDYVVSGAPDPVVYTNQEIGGWGLSVCYDLRFPTLYSKLAQEGAQILSVPSAFTYTTGQDHWEPLLRARAIENTSYVIAPAQTGKHGANRKTWGHSMIVDPWGDVIADAGIEPGVAYGTIDPQRIQSIRKAIPSLQHRRI